MRVVIIEDEVLTAENLAEMLRELQDDIRIVRILHSVKEAIDWFKNQPAPDLIFCDIQLGDGYSFEIFDSIQIKVPVIFCTAFNTYAADAFRNNGIDYILKPFTKKTIEEALDRYNDRNARFAPADYTTVLKNMPRNAEKVSSLLVSWKDKIIPVKIEDIALFTIEYRMTQLITLDNQKHFINHTLEELEELCGERFFRANRQYLVNRESVAEVLQHFPRKLLLQLKIEGKYEIIISKNRVPEFLAWLRK